MQQIQVSDTVIITGGAGFIGSALAKILVNLGVYTVVNIDNLTYCGNTNNISNIINHPKHIFIKEDIINAQEINKIFNQYHPKAIIHLAAESHVDNSIISPKEFISTNIVGTFTLLEVARSYYEQLSKLDKQKFRFVHVSTDEVFGTLQFNEPSFNENSNYRPNSPYSASKASSDMLVRAWYETYALPTVITNCTNNYGPQQYHEKLIPLIINQALAGAKLTIYGNGQNIRDWLYVDDHAKALIFVMEKGVPGQNYCIGANNEYSNLSLVEKICDILDEVKPKINGTSYREQITFVNDRLGHDLRYSLDASKISKELGWQPEMSFDDGLWKTVAWYLSY
jgi:dTDP-glucose 4,6-dehydratase